MAPQRSPPERQGDMHHKGQIIRISRVAKDHSPSKGHALLPVKRRVPHDLDSSSGSDLDSDSDSDSFSDFYSDSDLEYESDPVFDHGRISDPEPRSVSSHARPSLTHNRSRGISTLSSNHGKNTPTRMPYDKSPLTDASPLSPNPRPSDKLPIRDKFSNERYFLWLNNLSDTRLQSEQLRCAKAKLSSTSGVVATAGAITFLGTLTGGVGLALNAAAGCQKFGRVVYYRERKRMCDAEMKKRGLQKLELRDRDVVEEVGMGVVKAVVVRTLVG